MLVMAGALGWALTWRVQEIFLYNAARSADAIASAAIVSQLGTNVFASELSAEDAARIDELLARDLRTAEVFAVKLWDPRGVLIYSSDPDDPIGTSFADDEEVAAALQGDVIAEIKREAQAENERQFAYSGALIEVYAPVEDPVTGKVLGIFETYQPYAPIRAEIRFATTLIWTFLLVGTGAAYVIQLGMVRSMAHNLDETEAEVLEVNARLESSLAQIEEHSLGTLQALNAAVDAKDSYTASHCLGVTDYVVAMAAQLKLSKSDVELLERAALLHDIGKIGVPESILLKPARLTSEEFAVVKQHSASGGDIIESIPFLQNLVPLVRHHHEHWDGTGYPDGLTGEGIPRLARILSVADAFEAMTSDRPYRVAMSVERARCELLRCRGIQFDPEAVDALLAALDRHTITVVRGGGHTRRSENTST
jgi:putative nucleotidyltransferase with HDIG domain